MRTRRLKAWRTALKRQRGDTVPYYDIVMGQAASDSKFAGRLGFRRVFDAVADIGVLMQGEGAKVPNKPFIAIGHDAGWLTNMMKNGAVALVVERNDADRKLLAAMRDHDTVLLVPFGQLTGLFGIRRTRTMYFMQAMVRTAMKMKVRVGFASLAASRLQMCSYMQLIELAKLVGAPEKLAREALEKVNKELGECNDA